MQCAKKTQSQWLWHQAHVNRAFCAQNKSLHQIVVFVKSKAQLSHVPISLDTVSSFSRVRTLSLLVFTYTQQHFYQGYLLWQRESERQEEESEQVRERKKREAKKQYIWIEQCTNISKRPNISTYFKCYLHFVSALTPQIKQKSSNCIRCTGKRLPLLRVSLVLLSLSLLSLCVHWCVVHLVVWRFKWTRMIKWHMLRNLIFSKQIASFLHSVCLVAIPSVRIVSNESSLSSLKMLFMFSLRTLPETSFRVLWKHWLGPRLCWISRNAGQFLIATQSEKRQFLIDLCNGLT